MTKFEEMNNMNTNFVALSDKELMEAEGASITLAGCAAGLAIFLGGRLLGQDIKRKMGW